MELDYAMLADFAEVPNGKLYLMGGSFDTLWAAGIPARVPKLSFAMRLLFSPAEMGRQHEVEINLIDADGKRSLATVRGPLNLGARNPDLPAGWKQPFIAVLHFADLSFPAEGHYSFEVVVNHTSLKSIPLRIIKKAE